jgi:hypothetical protein
MHVSIVQKVLDTARKEIGVKESPAGSNRQKYGVWYGMNGVPWCAIWCSFVFHKAGYPLPKIQAGAPSGGAYCPYFEHHAKKVGQWHKTPKPGDLALFHFGKNLAVHIGIVESVSGSSFTCIEGNTSAASNDNGGTVMRRNRTISQCRGFYRPEFNGSGAVAKTGKGAYYRLIKLTNPLMEGEDIKVWQTQMNWFGYKLDVDGVYGVLCEAACKDLQFKRKLEIDGIVGPNTWAETFQRD